MKTKFAVLPALALGLAVLAQAQAPAAAAPAPAAGAVPTKIAIIPVQNVILATKEGQAATAAISKKFQPQKEKFDKAQADIQGLQDQMSKGSATMSDDARAKIARDIDAKQKALKRDSEDAQAELDQEEQKMFGELGNKMFQVIQQYASQNGYAVVLDVSNRETSPVFWASDAVNISEAILKLYDQAHPGTAAAAAPAVRPAAAPSAPPQKKSATPPAPPAKK